MTKKKTKVKEVEEIGKKIEQAIPEKTPVEKQEVVQPVFEPVTKETIIREKDLIIVTPTVQYTAGLLREIGAGLRGYVIPKANPTVPGELEVMVNLLLKFPMDALEELKAVKVTFPEQKETK